MQAYWITFEDTTAGCCEGTSARDAKSIAEHISEKKVAKMEILPYPASPEIWQFDHPIHGKTPAFCMNPTTCAGHQSCPRSPCCTS